MVLLAYLLYGRSFSTRPTSVWSTILEPPERAWCLTLRFLWPRLWRRFAAYRLKPFAVLRKRLAAARLVFNLGIVQLLVCVAPFSRRLRTRYGRTLGTVSRAERYFFFGAKTMIICLPSMSGFCSTTACGARSPETRSRSL